MAGKKPSKPKPKPKTSYMFPWLHRDASKAVSAAKVGSRWINAKDHKGSYNKYSTTVMGTFTCNNDTSSLIGLTAALRIHRHKALGPMSVDRRRKPEAVCPKEP